MVFFKKDKITVMIRIMQGIPGNVLLLEMRVIDLNLSRLLSLDGESATYFD